MLFAAGPTAFADPGWPARAIWRNPPNDRPQTPAILWPDDCTWVLTNDVDDPYSYVGGSRALVEALIADREVECLEIPAGAAMDGPAPKPISRP